MVVKFFDNPIRFYGRLTVANYNDAPQIRMVRKIFSGVAVVALLLLGIAVGSFLTEQRMSSSASSVSAPAQAEEFPDPGSYDFFQDYRSKPSYIGTIVDAKLERGAVYYMPSRAWLVHSGYGEWFLNDTNAPVLRHYRDAGPYPYEVRLVFEPARYMNDGGAGLEVTLPSRLDYQEVLESVDGQNISRMIKDVDPPFYDVTSPGWRHQPVIGVTRVVPYPGFKLEDYYSDRTTVNDLLVGQSAYISTSSLTALKDSDIGYIDDYGYTDKPDDRYSSYVRLTRHDHGFTVCTEVPERDTDVYFVDNYGFKPMPVQLPVKLAC